MDFSSVCRTCLSTEKLNPIFLNPDDHKRYSTALFLTTGLKIEINDDLPQNMCSNCVNYLNDSLKFRKRSRETNRQLTSATTDIMLTKSQIDYPKIESPIPLDLANIKTEYTDNDSNETFQDIKDFLTESESESDFETTENLELYYDDVKNTYESNDLSNDSDSDYDLPLINRKNITEPSVDCKFCFKSILLSEIDSHISTQHKVKEKRRERRKSNTTGSLEFTKLLKKTKEVTSIRHFFKGFKCSFCDTECKSKDELVQHDLICIFKTQLKRGEGAKEMVECHLCQKKMLKASLKTHIRIKHAGLGPVCEHCGKKVYNNFRLLEHYRAKHGYEKLKCSMCDFETANSYTIRDHERRHRGETPFVCESCGAKFHAAYLLTQHKQSHTTDKPYKCDICPGTFKTKNSLLMHKGRCHSSLQYKCSLCDRLYPCRRYAVKHMRATHKYEGVIPSLQTLPRKETSIVDEMNCEDK